MFTPNPQPDPFEMLVIISRAIVCTVHFLTILFVFSQLSHERIAQRLATISLLSNEPAEPPCSDVEMESSDVGTPTKGKRRAADSITPSKRMCARPEQEV